MHLYVSLSTCKTVILHKNVTFWGNSSFGVSNKSMKSNRQENSGQLPNFICTIMKNIEAANKKNVSILGV